MVQLTLYRTNHAEILASKLAEVLREPLSDPLKPECLIVQGRGMSTWLSQQLAQRLGVFANAQFLYPRNFIQSSYAALLSQQSSPLLSAVNTKTTLFWALFSALHKLSSENLNSPNSTNRSELLAPALHYISSDNRGVRLHQLAERLARCFDEYLAFRPDMILRWEELSLQQKLPQLSDPEERWQAAVWSLLPEGLRQSHLASLEPAFHERVSQLASGDFSTDIKPLLPERVCLFGLSNLPPLYMRAISQLSHLVPIHLFALSPTEVWLADELPKISHKKKPSPAKSPDVHPLLASLGRVGVDFQALLETHAPNYHEPSELYQTTSHESLLSSLQQSLLESNLSTLSQGLARFTPQDRSLQLHACHGPLREVEVLHELLLERLASPTEAAAPARGQGQPAGPVKPQDIVVMAPDIERYAPFIEAVFNHGLSGEQIIPYRISDRSLKHEAPVLEGLRLLISLANSRRTAGELLDLLSLAPVHERFEIEVGDLPLLSNWLNAAGVRWGVDAQDRLKHEQPNLTQNTWRFGLSRLLLGYALRGGGTQTFAGTLPFDELEGQNALLAGKLAAFAEGVFDALSQLDAERSMAEWQPVFVRVLNELFSSQGDWAWQHQAILKALSQLAESAEATALDAPLGLPIIAQLLEEELNESQPAKSFMTGGVTFCAMLPMRSIPFRVVCLLGMDEDQFPRQELPLHFDLIKRHPKPGDRSRTLDDRYLFLEAILSARDALIITFVGQRIKDNSKVPPSVVVEELLECLDEAASEAPPVENPHAISLTANDGPQAAQAPSQRAAPFRAQLTVEHPLQPFSSRYFDGADPNLFSYRKDFLLAARNAQGARTLPRALIQAPLPKLDQERLRLVDLARFFGDPATFFLTKRLGVQLEDREQELKDREPLELDPLERYQLGEQLLRFERANISSEQSDYLLRAQGQLPLGTAGSLTHERVQAEAAELYRSFTKQTSGQTAKVLSHELLLPHRLTLELNLHGIYEGQLLRVRYTRPRAKTLMEFWIEHLAWCAYHQQESALARGLGHSEYWLRAEKGDQEITHWRLAPVEAAAQLLSELIGWYVAGQSEPLCFFPEASLTFAARASDPKAKDPLHSANSKFQAERSNNLSLQRLYGELSLNELQSLPGSELPGFEELSVAIYNPLLAHYETN